VVSFEAVWFFKIDLYSSAYYRRVRRVDAWKKKRVLARLLQFFA